MDWLHSSDVACRLRFLVRVILESTRYHGNSGLQIEGFVSVRGGSPPMRKTPDDLRLAARTVIRMQT